MREPRASAFGALLLAALVACTSLSSPPPTTTLAEAYQAATVVEKGVDVYVTSAKPNAVVLARLKQLNDAVHAALGVLNSASLAGTPLDFAAFNAAVAAEQSYAASVGVGR